MATNVDCTLGQLAISGVRLDVLQAKDRYPDDGDTQIAPGMFPTFTLLNSNVPRVFDFISGYPSEWSVAVGTATGWGTDTFDLYSDGGIQRLRAQGQGTYVRYADTVAGDNPFADGDCNFREFVARVTWHTGATAGIIARARVDTYQKDTNGLDCVFAEIDSGGLRLGSYSAGSRTVYDTVAFSPVDATAYWILIQVEGASSNYRAKYWTGERGDEPASWSHAWDYPTVQKDTRNGRFYGWGIHCQAGTAYFDQLEDRFEPDFSYLDQLTVEVNGNEVPISYGYSGSQETYRTLLRGTHDIQSLDVIANAFMEHDPNDKEQTIVIKFNGVTIQSMDWDAAKFPDVVTSAGAGADSHMASMTQSNDGVIPFGFKFIWLAENFMENMGSPALIFNIARLTWGGLTTTGDFAWNLITPQIISVDAEYIIGHPVYTSHRSNIIPALAVLQDHKSSVVPKGPKHQISVASIVPQAYVREDHKLSIVPVFHLWRDDDSSVIVSQEIWEELDSSSLVFWRVQGTSIHFRVLDDAIFTQLESFGITIGTRYVVGRVAITGHNPEVAGTAYENISASVGAITITGYDPDVIGPPIFATTGTVTVAGYDPAITGMPIEVDAGVGALTVASIDLEQLSSLYVFDPDEETVGEDIFVLMDKYLNRWTDPNPTVNVDFDIYTYSSDQVLRLRQLDVTGAYDWMRYLPFGCDNGKIRIRLQGYVPTSSYQNSIRIRLHTGTLWKGFNVEYERAQIGDDGDSDRGGTTSGYSPGPFTIVAEFDGSNYRLQRVDSLSPTLAFGSWDLNYSYAHTLDSTYALSIAIGGGGSTPYDHGHIVKLECWNDW